MPRSRKQPEIVSPARRAPIYGPEPFVEIGGAEWSHWDLWFCLVCHVGFGGDWEALGADIVARRPPWGDGADVERKLTHQHDLRDRLGGAGLEIGDLIGDLAGDKPLLGKARRKVLDQHLAGRDLTAAMLDTPSRRFKKRANRDAFDRFPVDPTPFADDAYAVVADAGSSAWRATSDLEAFLGDAAESARTPAEALAVARGVLTGGLEAFHDGYVHKGGGTYDVFLSDTLAGYVALPWRGTGIDDDAYLTDLADVVTFENMGLLYQQEVAVLSHLPEDTVEPFVRILLERSDELRPWYRMSYYANEAIDNAAWAIAAHRRFDLVDEVVPRLEQHGWQPFDTIAEAAIADGRYDLAVGVFELAVNAGVSPDHLRRRCVEVTGRHMPDNTTNTSQRHLRVVTDE